MNIRRFLDVSSAGLVLLFAFAACDGGGCAAKDTPTPGAAEGTNGGPCDSWGSCDDYLACRKSVCRPCGGDGEHYCVMHSSTTGACRPGLALEGGSGICRSTCGKVGQSCCKSFGYGYECSGAAVCNTTTNHCDAKAPPCADGPKSIAVTCVDASGCAMSVVRGYASSATFDEAKACVKTSFGCTSVTDKAVSTYKYCIQYPTKVASPIEVDAVDAPSALTCAQSHAGLKSDGTPVTVTPGACPSM